MRCIVQSHIILSFLGKKQRIYRVDNTVSILSFPADCINQVWLQAIYNKNIRTIVSMCSNTILYSNCHSTVPSIQQMAGMNEYLLSHVFFETFLQLSSVPHESFSSWNMISHIRGCIQYINYKNIFKTFMFKIISFRLTKWLFSSVSIETESRLFRRQ